MTIRASIIGPTGYAGLHLIRLLGRHPSARLTYLASRREELPDIREIFPSLHGRIDDAVARCRPIDPDAVAAESDVAFLALPHRASMQWTPALLDAGLRVIDLSADYRVDDVDLYERTYETSHEDTENLAHAVYGLPELYRSRIGDASLIANPGCYPTAALLALAPLVQRSLIRPESIVVNAASGVTGAGRTPKLSLQFSEQNESFLAYRRIGGHRHQPEIAHHLGRAAGRPTPLLFVPHLLPLDQGILETIYCDPIDDELTQADLEEAYDDAYGSEPFVRFGARLPNVKDVRDTNFCDLAVRLVELGEQRKVVAFSAEDNLIKGASGQAVQNMNLLFDLPETEGLL